MTYEDTHKLIQKYSKTYVPGECRSREYESKIRTQKNLNERLDLADTLFNELEFESKPSLYLNPSQKKHVKELILIFDDFTELCKQRKKDEVIILSLIFYVKKQEDNSIQIQKYRPTQKYGLTHTIFEIVLCNIIKNYLKEVYVIPRQPKDKNHNILLKG